jgi:hypothetical protein
LHIYSVNAGMQLILSPSGSVLESGEPRLLLGHIFRGDNLPGRSAAVGLLRARQLDIVSFDLGAPTISSFPLSADAPYAFVRATDGGWSFGTLGGVVYGRDGLGPGPLQHIGGCGVATSVAAARDGSFAIATQSTGIIVGRVTSTERSILGTIPVVSGRVELSGAGDILVAGPLNRPDDDQTLRIFSLPSGTEMNRPSTDANPAPYLIDFSLAMGGSRIGLVTTEAQTLTRTVSSLDGNTVEFSDMINDPSPRSVVPWTRLSPDGTLLAVPDGTTSPNVTTRLYKKGSLVNVVPGFPIVWLDDQRVLVNVYKFGTFAVSQYDHSAIFDMTGSPKGTVSLPGLTDGLVAGANAIYYPGTNAIHDLTTGARTWTGSVPGSGIGAVTQTAVIFVDRNHLLVESR